MRRTRRAAPIAVAVLSLTAVLAGCGSATPTMSSAPAPAAAKSDPSPRPARPSGGPSVKVARSAYGRILFDGHRRALYLFTRDSGATSHCYGACAASWPPYLVKRTPAAGQGTPEKLLGLTRRRDGRRQATFAGHPLYYYVGDRRPGQVLCQNVAEFGGTWLVLSSRG